MAMKPCKECKRELSSKAATCPHCGAPQKAKRYSLLSLIIVGTFVVVIIAAVSGPDATDSSAPTPQAPSEPAKPRVDKSPEAEKKRTKLIAELQQRGAIGKVECRTKVGDMWVTPTFMALPFDDKQSFASLVYAYCFDGSDEYTVINLIHNQTGNKVGNFSQVNPGLKLK